MDYKAFPQREKLDVMSEGGPVDRERRCDVLIELLRNDFGLLPTEEDRMGALARIRDNLSHLKHPIDDILVDTEVVDGLVGWIDELLTETGNANALALILGILQKLTEFSLFPVPILAGSIERLMGLLDVPDCVVSMACLMEKIMDMYERDTGFIEALIRETDFLGFLRDRIEKRRYHEYQIGLLFQIMARVVSALNWKEGLGCFAAVVNGRFVYETVQTLVLDYLHSDKRTLLPHVLEAVLAMQKSWTEDYNDMMSADDIERMVEITENAPKLDPQKTGDIVLKLLKFWNGWISYYVERENAADLVARVVKALGQQLNIYTRDKNLEILEFFVKIAEQQIADIVDVELFCVVMGKKNSFQEKLCAFRIFFAILKKEEGRRNIVDAGDCAAVWYDAFDACSATSDDYVREFLVATYNLFSADEDIARQVAEDEEWMEFLETTEADTTRNDLGSLAEKILYQFYSNTEEQGCDQDDGPFLPSLEDE